MWDILCLVSFIQHHVFKAHLYVACVSILFFNCQIVSCHMDISHFIYPHINWWVCGLSPFFYYYDCPCFTTHVKVFVEMYVFFSLGYILRNRIAMITLCLFCWRCAKLFSTWLHNFIFPPAMYECSNFFTFSPKLAMTCFWICPS